MKPHVALIWMACLTMAACGSPGKPALKPRPQAGLHIVCEPDDAQLYVDDQFMGTTKGLGKRPLQLQPGLHRIEIRRVGHFAHFAEVKLVRGVKQVMKVRLRKEPF